MIDGQKLYDQPLKSNLRSYDNIRNIATSQQLIIQLVVYYIIPISENTIS